jgi:glycosyltransferase involved in cell wall biosynthesis
MDILVDIAMVTYNQEKYIAQAIKSVLSQQTDFNYRVVIGDDCSSDSTLEICRKYVKEYPDKFLLINNEENTGLVLNYQRVFQACSAKYIAILEGDDYWIDPLKLQKQVDFLEKDDNIGLVHTDYEKLLENGRIVHSTKKRKGVKPVNGYVFNILIKENFITAATVCFRKEVFDKYVDYPEFIKQELITIDYSLWMELSYHSKVFYIDYSTAVFRVLGTSLTNSMEFGKKEIYYNKGRNIKKYYINKYSPENHTAADVDRIYDTWLLFWAIRLNEQKKAIEYLNKISGESDKNLLLETFVNNTLLFRLLVILYKLKSRVGQLLLK